MPKVLLAPLDWGLGHATRCIPIIKELLSQNCRVIVAASGPQKALLAAEFPTLKFVYLPGYRVKYGKNRAFTVLRLITSIPKILISIKRENAWLQQFYRSERPDLVISDNRYGFYVSGVVCVFVTHQLKIQTPLGRWADRFVQWLNYRAIGRFDRCWAPDEAGVALAGELSHPVRMPRLGVEYIGWLSRFGRAGGAGRMADGEEQMEGGVEWLADGVGRMEGDARRRAGGVQADGYLLVLLSGPEPQRSIFEKIVWEQAAVLEQKVVIVRGLPEGGSDLKWSPHVMVYDHLPAAGLETLIRGASFVLCRAGYSTIMDLARLQKPAILVPTPGQSEQEYLGGYLAQKGWAVSIAQTGLRIKKAVEQLRQSGACWPSEGPAGSLQQAVSAALGQTGRGDAVEKIDGPCDIADG